MAIDADNLCSLSLLGISSLIGIFWWRSLKPSNLPPGPPALPLVGSIPFLGLTGKDDHLRFQELAKKYGNIFSFWLGQRQFCVFISGYDLIKQALLDHPAVMTGRPTIELYNTLGTNPRSLGLITPSSTAPGFKKERQTSLSILKDFGFGSNIMQTRIQREVDDLLSHVKNFDGKPQDLRKAINISVCNVICAIVLGKRHPLQDCEEVKAIIDAIEMEVKLFSRAMIVNYIPMMAHIPSLRKTLDEVVVVYSLVSDFISRSIEEHKEAYVPGSEEDFIDAFFGRLGMDYCSERLLYIVRALFVAGTGTVATTLQWSVVYMANNPDIQMKVQSEIDKVVGIERLVSLEDKPLLPYTEAAVLEVQRLASQVPLSLPHGALVDSELGGYHIPANSMVFINLWSVLRDPVLWPEPEKFQPERFLDDRGCVVHRSELIPFSLGRRSCLGEALAKQELFLFFCGLVQNFNIRPPDGVNKLDEKGETGLLRNPLPFEVILNSRK